MHTLKKIISRYIYRTITIAVAVIMTVVFFIEAANEKKLAHENAIRTFSQMEQVLEENQKELDEVMEEYKQTCLHNAEAIARIIEGDYDILDNPEEMKEIAVSVEVDEIHIFDKTGCIFAGTNPEYYGYTFDSGEQIMFFKPLLEDKTLKLVQDITPNTAEGKQMQYAALWSDDGEFIVQVGMNPENVMKVTQKNELSYIFSLFRVNPEVYYYAIDAETGEIVGSSDLDSIGKDSAEIGLDLDDMTGDEIDFNAKINGKDAFGVLKKIGSNYIVRVILKSALYRRLPGTMLIFFLCLTAIALLLAYMVVWYMNKYVVNEIHEVNKKLKAITDGKLEEVVDVQRSIEFSNLSEYINVMVKSLLDNNKKISYVLSKTNLYIGVYEYNRHMERVRFTEYIPQILSADIETMEQLSADPDRFRAFLDKICANPVSGEESVYRVDGQYVKLEEIKDEDAFFGVAIDVTDRMMKRREIEMERDTDLLTGLYNRRGLEAKLSDLFSSPEKLKHSAILMIDADGLKEINDTYGHEMGDIYLKKISGLIQSVVTKSSIFSRQGGDEFVLLLYGYESEEALMGVISSLEHLQDHYSSQLAENLNVPLRFSVGFCLAKGSTDYHTLIKEADEKMYTNKLERKKLFSQDKII